MRILNIQYILTCRNSLVPTVLAEFTICGLFHSYYIAHFRYNYSLSIQIRALLICCLCFCLHDLLMPLLLLTPLLPRTTSVTKSSIVLRMHWHTWHIPGLLPGPTGNQVIKPPGWQCCNGHVLCNNCRNRSVKCPVCRVPLGPRGRCLLSDKLFTLLAENFPCDGGEYTRRRRGISRTWTCF